MTSTAKRVQRERSHGAHVAIITSVHLPDFSFAPSLIPFVFTIIPRTSTRWRLTTMWATSSLTSQASREAYHPPCNDKAHRRFVQSNQKDRATSYLTLLTSLLSSSPISPTSLAAFGRYFTVSTNMATVVGRRVLGAFVIALCAGSGMARTITISGEGEESGDEEKWDTVGKKAFRGEKGAEVRREVVEGVLSGGGTGGWCDEQVSISKSLPLRTIHLVSRRNLR